MQASPPMNLPIGTQDFPTLRETGCIYVDKTALIHQLLREYRIYFLSRPRRFGKSLLISTLESIFLGKRELFQGLAIDALPYDWKVYPVIRIDMSVIDRTSPEAFTQSMKRFLSRIAEDYQVKPLNLEGSVSDVFSDLILALSSIDKVVVLIDEYDKPILDNLKNIEVARAMRDLLRDFYTILKAQDAHLRFLLLTGVTKFSKVSVFSGLNNLQDVGLTDQYSSLLGYTQEELEAYFPPHIDTLAEKENLSRKETLQKIKRWYNGYQFSPEGTRVYNPFSTLLLFAHKAYRTHWFNTGTPTFLLELIDQQNYIPQDFRGMEVGASAFESADIEKLSLLALLYQTGYLTIKSYDKSISSFILDYPNLEVEQSFEEAILTRFAEVDPAQESQAIFQLIRALQARDWDRFFNALKAFLANIPYEFHQPTERYYQSIFYLIFRLLGYRLNIEVHTHIGRIDALLEFKDETLIFEFKLDQSAEVALQQIKDREYFAGYLQQGKPITLIGVSFGSKERNVLEWKSEVTEWAES